MLFGNESNDTIDSAGDQAIDDVKCGFGEDETAYVDKIDRVKDNRENVFLLLGKWPPDLYTEPWQPGMLLAQR